MKWIGKTHISYEPCSKNPTHHQHPPPQPTNHTAQYPQCPTQTKQPSSLAAATASASQPPSSSTPTAPKSSSRAAARTPSAPRKPSSAPPPKSSPATTSVASIDALVKTASSFFGNGRTIDLLFINAGYAALEPFADVSEASFRRTVDTNVFGAYFAAQKLAPMVAPGGAIVFATSVANQMGIPGMSVYSASKAAVHSLVQTLATELVEFERQGVKSTPMGRTAEPEEVARAVAFLGFEATFTTGEQVVIDGGLATLRLH